MYARTLGGDVLSFGVSGMLWRENLVMYDRQTDSWWSQADGVAIRGPRRGERLTQVTSDMMSWRQWRVLHPSTLVLSPPRGTLSGPDRYARYHRSRDIGVTGRLRSGGALDAKARVLGFRLEGRPYVVALDQLSRRAFAQVDAGGQSVLVVSTTDGQGARAFLAGARRFVEGSSDGGRIRLRDADAREWDGLTGRSADGATLEPLTAHLSYWFSWYSFFPQTAILTSGAPPR